MFMGVIDDMWEEAKAKKKREDEELDRILGGI